MKKVSQIIQTKNSIWTFPHIPFIRQSHFSSWPTLILTSITKNNHIYPMHTVNKDIRRHPKTKKYPKSKEELSRWASSIRPAGLGLTSGKRAHQVVRPSSLVFHRQIIYSASARKIRGLFKWVVVEKVFAGGIPFSPLALHNLWLGAPKAQTEKNTRI